VSAPPLSMNAWLRHDAVGRLLAGAPAPRSVLEIGCGLGAMGARLAAAEYVGIEPDPDSRAVARTRLPLVLAALDELDAGRTFDLVCAFEVLEHVADDRGELARWAARVAPGGRLALSVPAHASRWGAADVLAGHVRRYEPRELADLLEEAGLEGVRAIPYGGPLGYALEAGRNLLAARRLRGAAEARETRSARSARLFQPPPWLGPATAAVAKPFCLLQRPMTTRGPGLLALGRRPEAA
jgi:SAM-dependent methyltransferase